jgi:mRNA-degrading endonuclease RelE of RelBE toxin-antitoxin system
MRWAHTRRSERDYRTAPPAIQDAFDKQARLLLSDPHHPSLRIKKYKGAAGLFKARVNRDWRFYFTIEEDLYTIVTIIPYPK